MNYAPLALFVYNRPWHTQQTVSALVANPEAAKTPLYIFSDAAKTENEVSAVAQVRTFLREITDFQSVTIIEREENLGLARSIIDGVTFVCNKHEQVIVLEDDLVTSPYFLKYMNDGLEKYKDEQDVISIHGYVCPTEETLPETFFLRIADCWGWATWQRGWQLFEANGQKLLNELEERKLTYQFDFDGSYPYTKMLKNQIAGKNNSWAIRWYASAFLHNKLTLYPGRSLVHNIGMDGSGAHCAATDDFHSTLASQPIVIGNNEIIEKPLDRLAIVNFHKRTHPTLLARAIRKARLILGGAAKAYVLKQQYAPDFFGLWLNPFYHSRAGLRATIQQMAGQLNGRLLDIGCGRKPYRELFATREYIGLEIDSPENRANKQADFFYDGTTFPFPDDSFDSALCNQVLEHVFTPAQFLSEIHRVLKPHGLLLLTVPFVWDEHEQPWDYARYSSFGLKSLLENNGFEVIEHHKINADVRVLFQLLNAYLFKVLWTKSKVFNLMICIIIMSPSNILGAILHKLLPANADLYLDQAVLVRKL